MSHWPNSKIQLNTGLSPSHVLKCPLELECFQELGPWAKRFLTVIYLEKKSALMTKVWNRIFVLTYSVNVFFVLTWCSLFVFPMATKPLGKGERNLIH